MNQPTVFKYMDYRAFLKDYYDFHKKARPHFSYRYLASKAGINAPAFFKYLIEGKRGLTKSSLVKVVKALNLSQAEADYFEQLVFFNQAQTIEEKDHFFKGLMGKQKDPAIYRLSSGEYEFFSKWYHSAVREVAYMGDHKGDPAAIARLIEPAIKPSEAGESLDLLLQLGLLKKRADGSFEQANPILSAAGEVRHYALGYFQRAMARLAVEAFSRFSPEERLMSGITVSISERTAERFKARVREFRRELLEMARQDASPERVYTLHFNLFPLSKKIETRGAAHV